MRAHLCLEGLGVLLEETWGARCVGIGAESSCGGGEGFCGGCYSGHGERVRGLIVIEERKDRDVV